VNDIASILVHLDASPRGGDRLALARRLAPKHGASVQALYAVNSSFVELPFAMSENSDIGLMTLKLDADRRKRARGQFDRALATTGAPVEWAELEREPAIWGFVQQALHADLLVLGQREIDPAFASDLPADFLESVLMGSGKPALVLPCASAVTSEAQRILVAWKGSRESAGALFAALPLLRNAGRVDVAAWEDEDSPLTAAARDRLTRCLEQHGVTANLHWYGTAPGDVGESVLSLAADLGSDLLVTGCYGHARAREWVLGGTTRTLLKSMTVPVLMAH
jgi:nucleotide-binding universal stress UspA family protein